MPIYEYECPECEQVFEEWCKSHSQECAPCPECSAESKRIISNTAFILKGGGWYADGYGSSNGTSAEPASGNGEGKEGSGEKGAAKADSNSESAAAKPESATAKSEPAAAKPAKKESKGSGAASTKSS